MLFLAIHDVRKPAFDHGSVLAGITTDHWHLKISASVVNLRDWSNEILVTC
jgi:hypothetical protein